MLKGCKLNLLFFILTSFLLNGLTYAAENKEDKTVLLAVLARNKEHTLPKFLKCIDNLDYNKKLVTVYINTNDNEDKTADILEAWIKKNEDQYQSIIYENYSITDNPQTRPHEWNATRFKVLGTIRNKSLQKALECKCDYYFIVDCDNFITPITLKELMSKDKPIIAPLLRPVPEAVDNYSNYFCAITENGYYDDHPEYNEILNKSKTGTFKVPVVHCTYLIKSEYLDKLSYVDETEDYEFVIFSRQARNKHVDQYICNEKEFGTLLHFHTDLTLEEEKKRFEESGL